MNRELLDVQAGFRKGRGTRDQIANIPWIIEKAKNSRKTSTSAPFDCVDHTKLENSSSDGNTRPLYLPPDKTVCISRSNSEKKTGSKLGKEYVKAVYCHPIYLTYMQVCVYA